MSTPTPAVNEIREALANALSEAMGYGPLASWGDSSHVRHMRERADTILADFEVRQRSTVTEAERLEYTIAAVSDNGTIFQIADYTTVVREHLKADFELYRLEQERAKCDPERIVIAERPTPKWRRS